MVQRKILADHSYNELMSLLEWFKKRGPIPTIIGGWAVYFYNSYLGSVDIDLVSYSMGGMFDQLLTQFEISQGYEETTTGPMGLGKTYRKRVIENNLTVGFIEIDACTYESDPRVFHENEQKELPYSLCSRQSYTTHVDLGKGLEANIPNKSLLFLYKLKAFRDRTHDLRTKEATLSATRREWLRAKIDKDGSDMIALLDPKPSSYTIEQTFNKTLFKKIIDEFDLNFALDTLDILPHQLASLHNYPNASSENVAEWVEKIS
jgi:hypothetical protein